MKNNFKIRFTSLFICICILIPLFSSCGMFDSEYRPALWCVSGKDGEVMYIMGSVHIGEESMYPFDDRINSALKKCDSLAVEYDVVSAEERSKNWTQEEQLQYISQFIYKDGDSIKNHLSADTYSKAKAYLISKNAYSEEMDLFVPAFWHSMINSYVVEESGYDSNIGVDRVLIKLARETGKKVLEVESEQFQTELTLSFDDVIYDDSIMQTIDARENISMQYAYMIDLWKRGRDDLIDVMSNGLTFLYSGPEDEEYAKAYEEYNNKMMTERNKNMAEVADGYIKDGKKVFFVVGAAHVCGEDGIIELLRAKGYTVDRV